MHILRLYFVGQSYINLRWLHRNNSKVILRGLVKILPKLRRVGNNGRPWIHVAMCDNIYSDIYMKIHVDSCFNLLKSGNRPASYDRMPHFYKVVWVYSIISLCSVRGIRVKRLYGLLIWVFSSKIIGSKT